MCACMNCRAAHGRTLTDPLAANVHRLSSARENIFPVRNCSNAAWRMHSADGRAGPCVSGRETVTTRDAVIARFAVDLERPCHGDARFASWRFTPTPTTSSSSAPGPWPCSREAGCAVTIATMTPGRLRQRRARLRGDRRDPPRRGEGGGRPDRGGLPLPRIPRPGDLQRRRFAAAGDRGPPPGPARHHPDRAAGRLPLRPRDDQPAGPRRLLRRLVPELRHPPVGARARRSTKIPHLYFVDPLEGADRDGRPVAGRFPRRRLARLRDQAADARLPRQPAQLAAPPARDRRVPGQPGEMGRPAGARRSASPRPRGSASTRATPTRTTTCCSSCSARTAAASLWPGLDRCEGSVKQAAFVASKEFSREEKPCTASRSRRPCCSSPSSQQILPPCAPSILMPSFQASSRFCWPV